MNCRSLWTFIAGSSSPGENLRNHCERSDNHLEVFRQIWRLGSMLSRHWTDLSLRSVSESQSSMPLRRSPASAQTLSGSFMLQLISLGIRVLLHLKWLLTGALICFGPWFCEFCPKNGKGSGITLLWSVLFQSEVIKSFFVSENQDGEVVFDLIPVADRPKILRPGILRENNLKERKIFKANFWTSVPSKSYVNDACLYWWSQDQINAFWTVTSLMTFWIF